MSLLTTASVTTIPHVKSGSMGNVNGEGRRRVMLKRMPSYGNQRRPLTLPVAITPPESPPLTPVSPKPKKTVHFCADGELEQIRLFLKHQMPRAAKSDPPCLALCRYRLAYPSWPVKTAMYKSLSADCGVRMESIQLDVSGEMLALAGRCRVANLAFEKHVVVRYTNDCWDTFHEVYAAYREPIASITKKWDRFTFRIPLEAKRQTIFVALHYTTTTQEFWDNNQGHNYQLDVIPPDDADYCEDTNKPALSEDVPDACTLEAREGALDAPPIPPKERSTRPLGRRYDFGASLSAARQKSSSACFLPASPPSTPIDEISPHADTPRSFFTDSTVHKNNNNNATPTNFTLQDLPTPPLSLSSPSSQSQPPAHPVSSDFQTGYQDFVSKYCFYNSPSIYSTSPRAIRS